MLNLHLLKAMIEEMAKLMIIYMDHHIFELIMRMQKFEW